MPFSAQTLLINCTLMSISHLQQVALHCCTPQCATQRSTVYCVCIAHLMALNSCKCMQKCWPWSWGFIGFGERVQFLVEEFKSITHSFLIINKSHQQKELISINSLLCLKQGSKTNPHKAGSCFWGLCRYGSKVCCQVVKAYVKADGL